MKVALIYLAAGIATGWQLIRLILWSVWGRPAHAIELIALCGAIILIAVSFFAVRWRKGSAFIAIASSILLWFFYIPSLLQTIQMRVGGLSLLEHFVVPGDVGIVTGIADLLRIALPPLLLLWATVRAALTVRSGRKLTLTSTDGRL